MQSLTNVYRALRTITYMSFLFLPVVVTYFAIISNPKLKMNIDWGDPIQEYHYKFIKDAIHLAISASAAIALFFQFFYNGNQTVIHHLMPYIPIIWLNFQLSKGVNALETKQFPPFYRKS